MHFDNLPFLCATQVKRYVQILFILFILILHACSECKFNGPASFVLVENRVWGLS